MLGFTVGRRILLKLQLDAKSGPIFHDDAQVWSERAEKRWCAGFYADQQASVTAVIKWATGCADPNVAAAAAAAAVEPARIECVDLTNGSCDSDDVGGDADGESDEIDDGVYTGWAVCSAALRW